MKDALAALVVALLAADSLFASQAEQSKGRSEEGYRFTADVTWIPVPVFVTDAKGEPFIGLTADDFVIKEDGKARPIEIFEPVVQETKATAPLVRPSMPALRRQFLLVFDLNVAKPRGLVRARNAAIRFVKEQLAPSDLDAVATYSAGIGVKILLNFSTDRAHALQAIYGLGLSKSSDQVLQDPVGFAFDARLEHPPDVQGYAPPNSGGEPGRGELDMEAEIQAGSVRFSASNEETRRIQAWWFLSEFDKLVSGLGAISGRKLILFFSEGIGSRYLMGTGVEPTAEDLQRLAEGRVQFHEPGDSFGRFDMHDSLVATLRRASGMDVVIHALDTSGLGDDTRDASARSSKGASGPEPGRVEGDKDSLYLMAKETGGNLFREVNELGPAFERILTETRAYYLLGFRPEKLETKGRFRKIQVEVKRGGLDVSARRGYFEPNAAAKLTDLEKRLSIAEYVAKELVSEDVSFDSLVTVYPGKASIARVPVLLKIPGAQFLKVKRASNVFQLEVFGYAVDAEGRFMDFFNKTLTFDLNKDRKRLEAAGIKYYDLLVARPGRARIKLIARDVETARTGALVEDIDVADFSKDDLFLTTPVFPMREPDWIVARGFDPAQPEPRRRAHPVQYPFLFDGKEFVPGVRPALKSAEPAPILVRVHHLKPHPTTGQPQTEMKFELIDSARDVMTLKTVGLVRKPTEPEPGCYELLLEARWEGVPAGPFIFQLSITDTVAKKTVQSRSAFSVVP